MHFDYIEIGTADFDTIVQAEAGKGLRGLSVDPVRYYLDRLPVEDGNVKVCAAIGREAGAVEVVYLRPELIAERGLPAWLKGCTCLGTPHPLAWREAERLGLGEAALVRDSVEVLSFLGLAERYGVKSLDRLKVDAEGMDLEIVGSYLDACEGRPDLLAREIVFEIAHQKRLGLEGAFYRVRARLARWGYGLEKGVEDVCFARG